MRGGMNVDPSTLNMSFSVTLGDYPGRGVSLPVTMNYASKVWRLRYTGTIIGQLNTYTHTKPMFGEYSVSGWTVSLDEPYFEYTPQGYDGAGNPYCFDCDISDPVYWVERVILYLPGGVTHELRRANDAPVQLAAGAGAPALSGVYVAVDGSRLKFDYLSASEQVIYMPDGSRYRLLTTGAEYIDRNGNKLTYDKTNPGSNPNYKKWTDTLGRAIGVALDNSNTTQPQQLSLPAVGGQTMNFQLVWKNLSQVLSPGAGSLHYRGNLICQPPYNGLSPALFNTPSPLERVCGDSLSPTQGVLFDPVVLNEIILPNNQKYTFTYNVYGEIDKITLPTGGYQRYVYAQIEPLDSDQQSDLYRQTNRGVTAHYVSATGQAVDEKQWTYAISTAGGKYTVSVTGPNGARAERDILRSAGSMGFSYDDARSGSAYEERTYTSGSQMWRRTLTEWDKTTQQLPPPFQYRSATRDPRPIKKVEILLDTSGDALATTTTMSYDADLNQTVVNKYAYATVNQSTAQTGLIGSIPQGALLRTEDSKFLVNDSEYSGVQASYRNRHLIALPTQTLIKNGSGAIVAVTRLSYDEAAYAPLTYASATGWTNPNTTYRGNVTTTKQWKNFNGTSFQTYDINNPNNNTFVVTHAQPDQCGSIRKTWDGKGAISEITYTDSFSGGSAPGATYAYPTQTTSPPPISGGTQLTTSTVYDYKTGKATSATDPNGQVTASEYNDSLNRVTRIVRSSNLADSASAKSQTVVSYDDANRVIASTTSKDSFTDLALKAEVVFDNLGRISEKRTYETSTTYTTVKTIYDDLGRVYQVSNPYRSGDTVLWTTTAYDALSRVISMTTPDGAAVTTAYDRAQVMVTDQAGKKRISETDALGRLIKVWEIRTPDADTVSIVFPQNGTTYNGYLTQYSYDSLGNLTTVAQGAQTRTFVYDSLSRLLTATNPESGAANYRYDDNSNLTTKTDARGITATMTYDALNRVRLKDYSDTTPDVSYVYDNQALPGGAPAGFNRGFALGRMVAVNYGSGSAGSYYGYDEAGRAVNKTQQINGNNYSTSASYNRADLMTGGTHPSGRAVTYSFDQAGRLDTFRGNLGDGTWRTYAKVTQYAAAGMKERESYGVLNGIPDGLAAPLHLKLHYNKRQQMVDLRLGSVQDEWNYDRGALIFYYGTNAVANWNPFQDDADNNGNVRRQINYVPKPAGGGDVIPQLDDYNYDNLNRISSFTEWQLNDAGSWVSNVVTQNYSYDRYGNRCASGATGGVSNYCPTYTATNNRISGLTYDAAGNITFDVATGGTMSYDAENRLLTATSGGGGTYAYDGEGRRVKRTLAGGQEWWYVYGVGGELVAEYLASAPSTVKKEYGYRGGQLLVVWDADKSGNEQMKWLVTDHLGSTRMEADKSGSLAGMRRHDYAPFGEEMYAGIRRNGSGQGQYGYEPPQSNVRQRFTGYERDNETGLDFAQARYYANLQGRFTSVDPLMASAHVVNPQTWNRYSYSLNNPLAYTDPDGLKPVFKEYLDLTEDERRILENSKITVGKGKNAQTLSGQKLYDYMKTSQQKQLANFLNQTAVLNSVKFENGRTALSYVNSVSQFKQDRIIANVDSGLIGEVQKVASTDPNEGIRYVGPEDSSREHGIYDTSFRENRPKTSQQLSFAQSLQFGGADIDIDEECPYCGSKGATLKHAGRVVIHKITGGKTNPFKIYDQLTTQRRIQPSYENKK